MVIPDASLAPSWPKVTPVGSSVAMAQSKTLTGNVVLADFPLTFLGGLAAFSDPGQMLQREASLKQDPIKRATNSPKCMRATSNHC